MLARPAYTNGNWTVTGGGSDIWNAADSLIIFGQHHFYGDGSITCAIWQSAKGAKSDQEFSRAFGSGQRYDRRS